MYESVESQLSVYLDKIKIGVVKQEWVMNNLPELWSFIRPLEGEVFSEKVYRYYHGKDLVDSCKSCGKKTKFLSFLRGYRTYCSKKCSNNDIVLIEQKNENFKKRNLEKWGVDNPMKKEEFVRKLIESKSKQDWSKTNKKYKDNFKKKWGVDNPSKLEEVKNKKQETTQKNWGVKNPFQNKEIQNKIKETNTQKYGWEYPLQSNQIKEKTKETLLKNWNVTNPMKSQEIKLKFQNTCVQKYGFTHFFKSESVKENRKKKMIIEHNEFLKEKGVKMIDITDSGFLLECNTCQNNFSIYTTTFHIRKRLDGDICTICNPVKINSSFPENSIYHFIQENYGMEIIRNHKIDGRELDIFIPELKFGIEFNGIYWHSEKFKEKDYHLEKVRFFRNIGIDIFVIWEDDWCDRKEIIESMILNRLGLTKVKIGARQCQIKIVDNNIEIRKFLEENHIQGFVGSKVKLGLYYNDELVSLMTFGDLRKSLGSKQKIGHWELIRFCNKIHTSVIGGASKLFHYFQKNFQWDSIITYSKNDYSSGNLYKKLNFQYSSETSANYYWVIKSKRINRFNFRKDKLISSGENPQLTESQIMNEKGYFRVWDSGNKKWTLQKKS